jgi:hypothetical protein
MCMCMCVESDVRVNNKNVNVDIHASLCSRGMYVCMYVYACKTGSAYVFINVIIARMLMYAFTCI